MPFGPYDMLMDFSIASALIFVCQILRSKIRFIQNFFIPAGVLAGVLGLVLGPQGFNMLPFSKQTGSYGYLLVCVLFATLFLGTQKLQSPKKIIAQVGDTFFSSLIVELAQFGIALLFGIVVLRHLFPDLPQAFALMLPAGWAGGYGYATAIGGVLKNYNFDDALSVGLTMATAGMIVGNFGGIIMINIATRLGVTNFVKSTADLPESMKTGLVPEEERKSIGKGTISACSLDPLAWHIALVLIATGIGYFLNVYFKGLWPKVDVPMMCLTMLAGVGIQLFLNSIKLGQYVDKEVTTRIGSTCTDYLIVFGISSIKTAVVIQYAAPLALLCILGILICTFTLWYLGPRFFHDNWFERSIFLWGWATGNVACGVTLLRVIDPEYRSHTLEDYGLAYIIIAFIEIALVSLTPVFVGMGYILETTAVLLGAVVIISIIAIKAGYIHKPLGKTEEIKS